MRLKLEAPSIGVHVLPLRVRLREMVGGWHVHYAEYLHYLEMAASDHLESLGFPLSSMTESLGGMFFMRHLEIEYLREAQAYDHIEIRTWVEEIRGARVIRASQIRNQDSGQVLTAARAEWVWVDNRGRPERVPDEIIAALAPASQ
jgi:acyl-CoA thioester hydrolase